MPRTQPRRLSPSVRPNPAVSPSQLCLAWNSAYGGNPILPHLLQVDMLTYLAYPPPFTSLAVLTIHSEIPILDLPITVVARKTW